ncbi:MULTISPECIES: ergothioneine biosynthesis glutamate--cysteine ligase EgtA [unclassified Streptomyces]|uniref:ergothioneine biosynthesis glutamate--cysteine ligase EgtA n=1 Tax=unclassified Streptomyces TaxID=2593676 RepID=UPI002E2DDCEA|nr:ergothioneine biosynthesis glutamate--cysteine ligase EgtA [Streptomyces sp. NBC_00223]
MPQRTTSAMLSPADTADCARYAREKCLSTGPPRLVGVELEWLVQDARDRTLPVDEERLSAALEAVSPSSGLPRGSALSREPGGQVELSSAAAPSLTRCVADVREDLRVLRDGLTAYGYTLAGHGIDPWRPPRRALLHLPRYQAMESLFDSFTPAGRFMMGASASVQVCVDAGTAQPGPAHHLRRWRLAHLLGPVLVAAFANSPMAAGRPTGWRSTRQAIWARLDPSRTLAVAAAGTDPRAGWARYALDAAVMCVRNADEGGAWSLLPGMTFRQWIEQGAQSPGGRPPTLDDFAYHLGTMFPPVRPQGYLELRMIDAQPGADGWVVPLAVTTALFEDVLATQAAEDAVGQLAVPEGPLAPRNALWLRAARYGLTDPRLHRAALTCFTAAGAALSRMGAPDLQAAVAEFTDTYVARARCPADDLLVTAAYG